jgi:hypothetical protein
VNRARSAQRKPPADISRFPRSEILEGEVFYRTTLAPKGFGWFSSSSEGRFDLLSPRGTMYVARSVHCAAMERVAAPRPMPVDTKGRRARYLGSLVQGGSVAEEEADKILVYELTTTERISVADLTHEAAGRDFGVTNELSGSGGSYAMPQIWAVYFDAKGFGGIEYRARFVTKEGPDQYAVAVFGEEKEHDGPFAATGPARTLTEAAADARIPIRRKPAAITKVVDKL